MSDNEDRAKVTQQLTAYHALHSYYVDTLVTMGEQSEDQARLADAIAYKCGGLAFETFVAAIGEQKALRIVESMLPGNDDEGAIRLEVFGDDEQWHGLVRVLPDRLGLPVVPFAAMAEDLDAALGRLLDAPDEGGVGGG